MALSEQVAVVDSSVVADGRDRAMAAVRAELDARARELMARIERRHAERLAVAGYFGKLLFRVQLRLQIRRRIERRAERSAPRDALYSVRSARG